MTGEIIKMTDIAFMILSLVAATMVTVGISMFQGIHPKDTNLIVVISSIFALLNPLIIAWTNVVTSQIKNLNQSTISCYIYPLTAFFMLLLIVINNQFQETVSIYYNLGTNDWVLFSILGLVSVLFQNFRYISLKYDEPAKLS